MKCASEEKMFLGIRRHYQRVERELTTSIPLHQEDIRHRLIVPIVSLNLAARYSLAYACSISPHVAAVHVAMRNEADAIHSTWEDWQKCLSDGSYTLCHEAVEMAHIMHLSGYDVGHP
jgi:hypothetical protein